MLENSLIKPGSKEVTSFRIKFDFDINLVFSLFYS